MGQPLDLLRQGNADGRTDLYVVVTAWGKAGAKQEAEHLLAVGCQLPSALPHKCENVEGRLHKLEQWLRGLPACWETERK